MGHRLADTARRAEGFAALLDADCPHFAGPDVDVLKELTVDRAQAGEVICPVAQEFGSLTEFDNAGLNEIVLCVPQRLRCLGADAVPRNGGARNEIALPIAFEIAGIPRIRHSWLGYCTLYRRWTRSRNSAAVMVPRA